MKYLKMLGLAALAALALTGLHGVSPASAATLEVNRVTKSEPILFTMSLKSATSLAMQTGGFPFETCTESHVTGKTESSFTGTPTGKISELTFGSCSHTITVHAPGKLYIEWTSGTNGQIYWENTEITIYSTLYGTHINCKTGEGTPLGTLTGVVSGNATLHVNATLNCAPHLSSSKWTGTYTVTSPSGLGVSP